MGDEDDRQPLRAPVVRSRLVLEVASELVGDEALGSRQANVLLSGQRPGEHPTVLYGGSGPSALFEVAAGSFAMAIANPSALLTVAHRGVSPFRRPMPLAAVSVIPSLDRLVFAVRADLGVATLEEVGRRRIPLRLSLRQQADHGIHYVVDHVLQAAGFSLADVRAWGGAIAYEDGFPTSGSQRLGRVASGRGDAIFEEGADQWVGDALASGMCLLSLEDETLARLEAWGYRRAVLAAGEYHGLGHGLTTVDFSGFPIYVAEGADEGLVRAMSRALALRQHRIRLQDGSPLDLGAVCRGLASAPLDVPLHPAAEATWRELGYL